MSIYGEGFPECNDSQLAVYNNMLHSPQKHTNAWILAETGCLVPCDLYEYSTEPSYQVFKDDIIEDTVFVGFYTLNLKIPVHEQKYGYILDDFIADVGGYLGLLLGASMWSLYEIFIEACRRFL